MNSTIARQRGTEETVEEEYCYEYMIMTIAKKKVFGYLLEKKPL